MGKIEIATQWMIDLANDDRHGYDQGNRWGPDYDCSAAVITAWETAGVPVKTKGAYTTQNMRGVFLSCGFTEVSSSVNFSTGAGLKYGDVLHRNGHTAMSLGNGKIVHASINEKGTIEGGQTGDQTGKEILIANYYYNSSKPWTSVLRYTGDDTPVQTTLKLGSSGAAVTELQKKLNILGYNLSVDGSFGNATDAAVRDFQRKNGLAVDGIVGSATMAKINEKVKEAQGGGSTTGEWIQDATTKRWWYRHSDGSDTKNNWEKIDGTWYYFDADGWMCTGWVLVKGKWYYLQSNGALVTNAWIDKLYYVGSDGAMYVNSMTPDGYIVDGSGKWDGRDAWVKRLQTALKNAGYNPGTIDGVAGSATLAACPTLKYGNSGELVTLLQERLHYFFHVAISGGMDGSFGDGTKNAVIVFQSQNGLSADGVVGTNTWKKLLSL